MSNIKTIVDKKLLKELEPIKVEKTVVEPVLTIAMIDKAVLLLRKVEKNGGFGNISKSIRSEFKKNCTKKQVKEIYEAMQDRIAELNKPVEETK